MESEIERLTAENEKLKSRLKLTGEQLISTFAYDQRMVLAQAKGYTDLIIEAHINPTSNNWKENLDACIAGVRKNFLLLEEAREIGMMFGSAVMAKEYFSTPIALQLILIEIEEIKDYFPNFESLILSTNFKSTDKNQLFSIPMHWLSFPLKRITSDLLLFSDKSQVRLHFSNSETHLLIHIESEIEFEKANKIAGNQLANYRAGVASLTAKRFISLFDGQVESELIGNHVVVDISLPLVEMEEADGK